MPKGYLKEIEYREEDVAAYITELMKRTGKNQSEIATALKTTQGTVSKKLKTASFTTHELLTIFKMLKADSEAVGKLFTF